MLRVVSSGQCVNLSLSLVPMYHPMTSCIITNCDSTTLHQHPLSTSHILNILGEAEIKDVAYILLLDCHRTQTSDYRMKGVCPDPYSPLCYMKGTLCPAFVLDIICYQQTGLLRIKTARAVQRQDLYMLCFSFIKRPFLMLPSGYCHMLFVLRETHTCLF